MPYAMKALLVITLTSVNELGITVSLAHTQILNTIAPLEWPITMKQDGYLQMGVLHHTFAMAYNKRDGSDSSLSLLRKKVK